MTKIWNETGFVTDDPWVIESEEAKAGSNEKAILGIDDFLARAAEGDEQGFGVLVNPADDVRRLADQSVWHASPWVLGLMLLTFGLVRLSDVVRDRWHARRYTSAAS